MTEREKMLAELEALEALEAQAIPAEPISLREFARQTGENPMRISRWVKSGRCPAEALTMEGKRQRIIPSAAWEAWKKYEPAAVWGMDRREAAATAVAEVKSGGAPAAVHDGMSKQEADAVKAIWMAKMKQIEVEERTGKLVNKQAVFDTLFEVGGIIKKKFREIPDRTVPDMMDTEDVFDATEILRNAIDRALQEVSDLIGGVSV